MAKIEFTTKYEKGDELFIVRKGRKLCTKCYEYHDHYFVYEAKITSTIIYYGSVEYGADLTLSGKNTGTYSGAYRESEFFVNREDAVRYCDSLNAKDLKDKLKYIQSHIL